MAATEKSKSNATIEYVAHIWYEITSHEQGCHIALPHDMWLLVSPPDMRGMGPFMMNSWHRSNEVMSIKPLLMIAPAPP